MKPAALILVLFAPVAFAGLPVTDYAHIASNQIHQARDLVEQLLQEANQQLQISQQDDYLNRFGDPAETIGDAQLDVVLKSLNRIVPHQELQAAVDQITEGTAFELEVPAIYNPIVRPITSLGEVIAQRDGNDFKPEVASRMGFEQYRLVRRELLVRKQDLLGALAATTHDLQNATTASELQRLTAIALSLQTQLTSLDNDLNFAVEDVKARALENQNEASLRSKAQIQQDRAVLNDGSRRDQGFYRLLTKPTLFRDGK